MFKTAIKCTMTVNNQSGAGSRCSSSSSKSMKCDKSRSAALALKRYLDLTLRGTRKNLADHYVSNKGKRGHPLSPYTFNQPETEKSVERMLQTPVHTTTKSRPPEWINQMNSNIVKHSGEAPLFTENFLPSSKEKQVKDSRVLNSRPLSGLSTRSAPILINGTMYCRQTKKHSYLQASQRPASAMEDRMTRTAKLRNRHKSQIMSGVPSDSTKDEFIRMKQMKPSKQNLNNDLLPIPCHGNETPHAFITGARYNCSNFMDSRSFSRLGLYVPRKNPLGTFLKTYKGDDRIDNDKDSETGNYSVLLQKFKDHTSVQTGGSVKPIIRSLSYQNSKINTRRIHHPTIPALHVRKVVKEAWLTSDTCDENDDFQQKGSQRTQIYGHSPPLMNKKFKVPISEAKLATNNEKPVLVQVAQEQRCGEHSNHQLDDLHLPKQSQFRHRDSNIGRHSPSKERVAEYC